MFGFILPETEDSEISTGSDDETSGWRRPFGSDNQEPQGQGLRKDR